MGTRFCVALLGRPNVGKSRLFNALLRAPRSIVHDRPGVTRDVVAADLPNGAVLLDTGGWGLGEGETPAELVAAVEAQVELAIAMADVLVFVLDGHSGISPLDWDMAGKLRRTGKRVLAVVNKIDCGSLEDGAMDACALGFPEAPLGVSAEHRRGIEALEERIFLNLPAAEKQSAGEKQLAIAFIGAPNVGKSSLTNALLGTARTIVSPVPGTTRDTVRGQFSRSDGMGGAHSMEILDTAGLRASGKMGSPVEYFSSVRARRALAEADVVFLVLDAARGLTAFDKKLAAEVAREGKCLAIAVNKWDIAVQALEEGRLEGSRNGRDFREKFAAALHRELFAWPSIPVLFVSAQSGENLKKIPELALELGERATQRIPTGPLNRVFQKALANVHPSGSGGKLFKVFYLVQTASGPHTFRIFCNRRKLLHAPAEAHLRRRLSEAFSLAGCPLRFTWTEKESRPGGGFPGDKHPARSISMANSDNQPASELSPTLRAE